MATAPRQLSGTNKLQSTIGLLVTAITIFLVSQRLDIEAILRLLRNIDLPWLGIALLIFTANYVLRALRFRLLTYSETPPLARTFGISAIHGMLNYLLPAKLGELAYPLLARSHLGLSIPEGAATLIVARFWDFAIIALLLPMVAIGFSSDLPTWAQISMVTFPVLLTLLSVILLWFVSRTSSSGHSSSSHGGRLLMKLAGLVNGLKSVHGQGNHFRLALLSAGIWLCIYGNFYALVNALGLETTLLEMAVVSTVLLPLTLLPLQGLANIGSHELGWVTALGLFGHDIDTSLQIAVGTHILLLLLVLCLGLGSMGCMGLSLRR